MVATRRYVALCWLKGTSSARRSRGRHRKDGVRSSYLGAAPGLLGIPRGYPRRVPRKLRNAGRIIAHQAYLEGANLGAAHLEKAQLTAAHLEGAVLAYADLAGAILRDTHLEGAKMQQSKLAGTVLNDAHLEGTILADEDLKRIQQWKPSVAVPLPAADLQGAIFDDATRLDGAVLGNNASGGVKIADARLNGVNLTVVDWTSVKVLGEEHAVQEAIRRHEHFPQPEVELRMYQESVRANRQLALALRSQGLSEDADRFAYSAQKRQRSVSYLQGRYDKWIGSWILYLLSGYGYRIRNIFLSYVCILVFFTCVYCLVGVHSTPHESGLRALWDSFLVSLSAIHGRTTFEQLGAWSLAAWVAALESVVGIVIEGVFVAMLIQRLFGK
jgi:Pentapeptide repeats (8 copies)